MPGTRLPSRIARHLRRSFYISAAFFNSSVKHVIGVVCFHSELSIHLYGTIYINQGVVTLITGFAL